METVFDLDPTDEELKQIFGSLEIAHRSRTDERIDQDTHFFYLSMLMLARKNPDLAHRYMERIQDQKYRDLVSELLFSDLV